MGTNYYVAKNKCDCCKRYDKEYHIGKSSWGWSFTFQGYPYDNLTSWKLYKEFLRVLVLPNKMKATVIRQVLHYDMNESFWGNLELVYDDGVKGTCNCWQVEKL